MIKSLTTQDILSVESFLKQRDHHKQRIKKIKIHRRVTVGPVAAFYFENFDTLWWQVQEMVRIERGGAAQILDEIEAYTPLIPTGSDWRATLMFEIPDPEERRRLLGRLGFVEDQIALSVNGQKVQAKPTNEGERTTQAGKTSAIHFLCFAFSDMQKRAIKEGKTLKLGIYHPLYTHETFLSNSVQKALAEDLT